MDTSRITTLDTRPGDLNGTEERNALIRLELLLNKNAAFLENERDSSQLRKESIASTMRHPMTTASAVAWLGFMTGVIPTSAIFAKLLTNGSMQTLDGVVIVAGFLIVCSGLTSLAGFYSGKHVGRILSEIESEPWPKMIYLLPVIGICWGLISGSIGGLVLLGIGAVFGGMIGAIVAPIVLTVFGIAHRLLKTGDFLERRTFLPLAFGITATIAAVILGL